ncbi:MAG: hypothetical protein F6K26_40135, partial [Moorea sp. SIO2I5]|nr:hypothetical protein [Moorena sp. SIO2I5]
QKDLVEVPDDVRSQIEVILCDRIEQVLENALLHQQEVKSQQDARDGLAIKPQ